MFRLALLLLSNSLLLGCSGDPGTTPVQIDSHRLEPQSVAYGRAWFETDGYTIFDHRYHVTWVVVSDVEDVCSVFEANARCEGTVVAGPRRPDGRLLEVSFNSFGERDGAVVGESPNWLRAQFTVREGGGVTSSRAATSGSMDPPTFSGGRVWAEYELNVEGGVGVRGSFSAVHCPAMDEILRKELYDLPACP